MIWPNSGERGIAAGRRRLGPRVLLLAAAVGVGAALLGGSPAAAATKHKIAPHIVVNIALTAPASVSTGSPIDVSVLVSSSGYPVVNHLIRFYAAGLYLGAAKTNSSGYAATKLRQALPVGTQTLIATYKGGGPVESARASRTILVVPAPLTIRVVPYVPGAVAVSINGGAPVSPNSGGYINQNLPVGGHVTLQAVLQNPAANERISFVSWSNGDTSTTRVLTDRTHAYTQLAVQVAYLTRLKFVTAAGRPVPTSQLQGVTLTGPDGTHVAVSDPSAVWLSTPAPRRTASGALSVGNDTYTAVTGYYDGVNVVNQGRDRFTPGPTGAWTVALNIYPVSLFSRNVVLGSQVPAKVALTGPGSQTRLVSLPQRGLATLTLPRGHYSVKLKSGGFGPGLKFRVSGASSVPIPIVTPLDIAGGVVVILLLIGGLLALGPWRRRVVAWVFAGDLRERRASQA